MSTQQSELSEIGSAELAEYFGVTRRNIQQLTTDGIIQKITVKSSRRVTNKYDLKAATQSYTKYLRDKAMGRTTVTEEELRKKKLEADIALKESQGELHRLKTAIANGEYISVEEVKIDYNKFFLTFKKFALSLPSRIVGLVGGVLDPTEGRKLEKELSEEMANVLNAFVVAGTEARQPEVKKTKKGRPRKKPE